MTISDSIARASGFDGANHLPSICAFWFDSAPPHRPIQGFVQKFLDGGGKDTGRFCDAMRLLQACDLRCSDGAIVDAVNGDKSLDLYGFAKGRRIAAQSTRVGDRRSSVDARAM
jgi:hypothetical protein